MELNLDICPERLTVTIGKRNTYRETPYFFTMQISGSVQADAELPGWVDKGSTGIPNISGWCNSEYDPTLKFNVIS